MCPCIILWPTHMVGGCRAQYTFNPATIQRLMKRFTPWPFFPRKGSPETTGWQDGWTLQPSGCFREEKNFSNVLGNTDSCNPTHSPSTIIYWLNSTILMWYIILCIEFNHTLRTSSLVSANLALWFWWTLNTSSCHMASVLNCCLIAKLFCCRVSKDKWPASAHSKRWLVNPKF